jgi:osmotically-inducible protein OsmY
MTKQNDFELRKDILDELEWDPSIDARKIGVAVEDGVVSLTGQVPSYSEKVTAERIVKRVNRVQGVANDLEVKLPSSHERSDADIAHAAINALEWNVSVPKGKVPVSVTNGWVTLEGVVDWYYQKRAAEDAVRLIAGVRGVTNSINLAQPRASAGDVKKKIEAALKRSAESDAGKIVVNTTDGKVTLSGTVRSFVEREDAVNAAWSAPGVSKVIDQIRVQP